MAYNACSWRTSYAAAAFLLICPRKPQYNKHIVLFQSLHCEWHHAFFFKYGKPWVRKTCPECYAAIGGTHHTLLADNSEAQV